MYLSSSPWSLATFTRRKSIVLIFLFCLLLVGCTIESCSKDITSTPTVLPAAPTFVSPTTTILNEEGTVASETAILNEEVMASDFQITDHNIAKTIQGTNKYIGIVRNLTSLSQNSVVLELRILDRNGAVIFSNTASAFLSRINGGSSSPFAFDLQNVSDLGQEHQLDLRVISAVSSEPDDEELQVRGNRTIVDDMNSVHVVGEFTNMGTVPIVVEEMAGAVYDAQGSLLDVGVISDSYYIVPDVSTSFRFTFPTELTNAHETQIYMTYSEGGQLPEVHVSTASPTGDASFVDQRGQYHLIGEAVNLGNSNIVLWLTGTLYSRDGHVIDVASSSIPYLILEPGQSQPYIFRDFHIVDNSIKMQQEISTYSVQVDPLRTVTTDLQPQYLEVSSVELSEVGNTLFISGRATNNTSSSLHNVFVVASLRNRDGQLDGASYTQLPSMVEPGNTIDFTLLVATASETVASELIPEVLVQGLPES